MNPVGLLAKLRDSRCDGECARSGFAAARLPSGRDDQVEESQTDS
jgi:hypothetical protein